MTEDHTFNRSFNSMERHYINAFYVCRFAEQYRETCAVQDEGFMCRDLVVLNAISLHLRYFQVFRNS